MFTQQSRREVRLVFGASGTFAQQIAHGAPFEVFLSADETYVEFLFKQGRAMDAGRVHSIGKLALYVPRESNSPVDWPGFVEALKNDRLRRIAIANPQIAPFGHAAREALQAEGVWERVADRLVLGENVGQAAQFALSGGADAALLPYSLVLGALGEKGRSVLVPPTLYRPIVQRMALIAGAGETARMFYEFVTSPAAQAVFRRYGYDVP